MEDSTAQRSLPFQFITEHGRRLHSKSATVSTVRSQARKYSALEQQRRNNPPQGRCNRLRNLRKAPDIPREGRISPRTILGAGRVDPFHSLPIENPYVYKLLDYCTIVAQQTAIGLQTEKDDATTMLERILTDWIPLCISNAMSFSALLLSSETALRAALNENPWSTCAIQLNMNCVRLLRIELDNPNWEVSDAMIATVLSMALVASVFDKDLATFERHRRGLVQMVKLRGGVDKLNGILNYLVPWTTQLASTQNVSNEDEGAAGGQEVVHATDDGPVWTIISTILRADHGISPISSTERVFNLN